MAAAFGTVKVSAFAAEFDHHRLGAALAVKPCDPFGTVLAREQMAFFQAGQDPVGTGSQVVDRLAHVRRRGP